jgi:peptide/nickel transport system permease protein
LNSADPTTIIAGDLATAAGIAKIRDKLGLNEPLWLQFRRWASSLAVGGLGGG